MMDGEVSKPVQFYRCSIPDNSMADIKTNKKPLMNLRNYFREYCDYTGIHGMKFIGERRSLCEKISWTIVFCLSLSTCIVVVYEVFKKWQKSPVIVNFAAEQTNIFDITFPAVTICPETKVYSDHFNYSFNLRENLNKNATGDQLKKLQFMSLICSEKMYYHKIPKVDYIGDDFFDFLNKGVPAFLLKCFWMGTESPCEKIFQPIYTEEGLCYTFNMLSKRQLFTRETKNIKMPPNKYHDQIATNWSADSGYTEDAHVFTYPRRGLLAGANNALEVNLAINNTDLDYGCTHFQGYKAVLHSPHRFPTFSSHYLRIPLRKSVSAAITPVMLRTSDDVAEYSLRKRKCAFQGDTNLRFFSKYSQKNCMLECFLNLTMNMCGCVEYYMPRNDLMPICGTAKYECVTNASAQQAFLFMEGHLIHSKDKKKMRQHFGKHIMMNLTKSHSCYCPDMCNSIDYNMEITESDYDWPRKMQTLGVDVVTEDEEGLSASQLVVYYKGTTFIPQERNELFGTFDFLANVGGLLGLFIGFSLLSMVECIYFLSLRILCNLNLYKTWYGKPETDGPANVPSLHKTSGVNVS